MSSVTQNSGDRGMVTRAVLEHTKAALVIGFTIVVIAAGVVAGLLGFYTISAIIVSWVVFLYVIVAVFAVVPYYAIEFLEY